MIIRTCAIALVLMTGLTAAATDVGDAIAYEAPASALTQAAPNDAAPSQAKACERVGVSDCGTMPARASDAAPVRPAFLDAPATPAPASRALRATFWGGAVAGGVLLTVGAVFGLLSETHAAAANERFDARTLTSADRAHYDAARLDAKVANVSFGAGAAALVAAAVAYLVDPGVADDAESTSGAGR